MTQTVQAFWNEQASRGATAGSQDLIAKELEHRAIIKALVALQPRTILEIGCGRGELARLVSEALPDANIWAVDSADAMIAEAEREPHSSRLRFKVRDVQTMWMAGVTYDAIYSERCLINLPSWQAQWQTIDKLAAMLRPKGHFLMCENSEAGLNVINWNRHKVGLPAIERPWHNVYFEDALLRQVDSLKLLRCEPFSATYYFLSRVVNAALAAQAGLAPEYDSPVNRLALDLPMSCVSPECAQGRLWVWEKR